MPQLPRTPPSTPTNSLPPLKLAYAFTSTSNSFSPRDNSVKPFKASRSIKRPNKDTKNESVSDEEWDLRVGSCHPYAYA